MNARLPATIGLYRAATVAFGPFSGVLFASRRARGKEDPARGGERRGIAGRARPAGPLVWMHGASVGETIAIMPLVQHVVARGFSVLVTSGTVTSAALMAVRLPVGAVHQYIPIDVPRYVRRFLDHWAPDLALFAESELWPNLILETRARGVPIILANARMSARSFGRWQKARGTIGALLTQIDLCLAQSPADAGRLSALGAPRVTVTGNLKFDAPAPAADATALAALERAVSGRPVFVAASTHPGEHPQLIETHRRLVAERPRLVTIIAPRHPDQAGPLMDLAAAAGIAAEKRSTAPTPARGTSLYVADTIGELGLMFRLGPVAFMGGSLVPHGGQNPIEPVKLGVAVLHGPHVHNFAPVYGALDEAGGSQVVHDAGALATAALKLIGDGAARQQMVAAAQQVIDGLSGALARTLAALEPYLMQIRLAERAE